jgi:hypothetical protein
MGTIDGCSSGSISGIIAGALEEMCGSYFLTYFKFKL